MNRLFTASQVTVAVVSFSVIRAATPLRLVSAEKSTAVTVLLVPSMLIFIAPSVTNAQVLIAICAGVRMAQRNNAAWSSLIQRPMYSVRGCGVCWKYRLAA
ncbi:hypothetical protein D3C73_896660 [compost metagenome]